ncbi:MAG: MFS transporter [Roseiflexaceae bacterium]
MSEHESLSPQTMRKNYYKGIFNGAVFGMGEAASSPGLVLSLLIRQLGGSLTLVGLLPVIQSAGYLLPQLIVGGRVQALKHKLPVYRMFAFLRILAQGAMVTACFVAGMVDSIWALAAILISYALFNIGGGVTTLSFQDVVAKIVPPSQRGRFFGTRQLLSGLLAFSVGGPLVRWVLSDESPFVFPYNFAVISGFSLICYAMAMSVFATVNEPPAQHVVPRMSFRDTLKAAPAMLRNNLDYRQFIVVRLFLLIGRMAEPFFIIYVTEQLGLPPSIAGIFVASSAVAAAISNAIWGRLGDSRGKQWLLRVTGTIAMLPPLMMLLAPSISAINSGVLIGWLLLLSLAAGTSADGIGIASMTYLLEVAPPEQRPLYMGLANTILGFGALIPVLGGVLVSTFGYQLAFMIAATCSCTAVILARTLGNRPATT